MFGSVFTVFQYDMQRYMAMWWAKYHAALKDYTDTRDLLPEASSGAQTIVEADDAAQKTSKQRRASSQAAWFLDAIDILNRHFKESDTPAIDRIKHQLADMNSEG